MRGKYGSVQRFVVEYANYKIRLYKDLLKCFPEKQKETDGKIDTINSIVDLYERYMISVDECMQKLSEV